MGYGYRLKTCNLLIIKTEYLIVKDSETIFKQNYKKTGWKYHPVSVCSDPLEQHQCSVAYGVIKSRRQYWHSLKFVSLACFSSAVERSQIKHAENHSTYTL